MRKDNKGFSFIEMLIVVAIIAIVAGLSMVTFNMANSRRPMRTRDNMVSCAKYSRSLVRAGTDDYCMALLLGKDGNYYAIQGNATGSSMADLRSSFKSENVTTTTTTESGSTQTKKVSVNTPQYTLSELETDPTIAANCQNLGRMVKIYYAEGSGGSGTGTEIKEGAANAIIIKFRKYDGSVLSGYGTYSFSQSRSTEIKCSITLEKTTGAFHK